MTPDEIDDLAEWWLERAAIAEFDGRMSRSHAESLATGRLAMTVPHEVVRVVVARAKGGRE
jgi:hypothetical protein